MHQGLPKFCVWLLGTVSICFLVKFWDWGIEREIAGLGECLGCPEGMQLKKKKVHTMHVLFHEKYDKISTW